MHKYYALIYTLSIYSENNTFDNVTKGGLKRYYGTF